ncbi:MAG TPA: type II toxin-antitoxin system VapC family toxin [Chloroflexota bacterium]|nr:type II toxin-antitoxin system VapC family toxin [Chloroflexota bacterium]
MNVFDASALLAFLQGEDGATTVEEGLSGDSACGTANWSEVAQKIRAHGRNWELARALLASYALQIQPVTLDDAEQAAATWTPGSGLSLADRLCLALGSRLNATVWTADSGWGSSETVRQIR